MSSIQTEITRQHTRRKHENNQKPTDLHLTPVLEGSKFVVRILNLLSHFAEKGVNNDRFYFLRQDLEMFLKKPNGYFRTDK